VKCAPESDVAADAQDPTTSKLRPSGSCLVGAAATTSSATGRGHRSVGDGQTTPTTSCTRMSDSSPSRIDWCPPHRIEGKGVHRAATQPPSNYGADCDDMLLPYPRICSTRCWTSMELSERMVATALSGDDDALPPIASRRVDARGDGPNLAPGVGRAPSSLSVDGGGVRVRTWSTG